MEKRNLDKKWLKKTLGVALLAYLGYEIFGEIGLLVILIMLFF